VRRVHSLFTSSDAWDEQIEGFESGWPGLFVLLRINLERFVGASAATFMVIAPTSGDALATWRRLSEALGVAGANSSERRTSSSSAPVSSITCTRMLGSAYVIALSSPRGSTSSSEGDAPSSARVNG